ncbi:amino acid ABC transporter substrate-binding protein, PAAT family [Archaeoglobus sulfaticallidus PM70-1]|uniref:Amino acid ABC transporter substrate-binding protein, PAAT family n=1 Tax=Archaeoglobus sulfaticallidus PM70-1 TaxID=387631 RepID=N0BJX4_9EURY|nr:basic amino acid ABC transporter substrate-binding protein [Archaeoglobus sulfaticallidus]AGK60801.1 amino acid ABC transporter substrate-binding protein, PAAT family [Archaeoglobus sulfaticallidus PM70-1]
MKKMWFVVVVLLIAIGFAGCTQSETPKQTPAPTQTPAENEIPKYYLVTEGMLTVGSDIAYPPFEFTDEKTGKYAGFDIDLMTEIAKRLGLEVKFVNTAWDGIIPGLLSKKYDVICSAMTITEERAKQVDFSEPYFEAKQVIITRADDTSIQSVKDLDGKKVAVQQGTTGDFAAERLKEKGINLEIIRFEGTPEALMAIQKGDADAAIIDNFVAYLAVKKDPKVYRVVEDPEFEPEYYGIAVNKDNKGLLEAINKALEEIKKDGTYDKIYEKWFGS